MDDGENTTDISRLLSQFKPSDSPLTWRLKVESGEDESDLASADYDYDSYDEEGTVFQRTAERWAPLGAAGSPTSSPAEPSACAIGEKLHSLEEEQEQLNSSLLALTTHFAQVQFRLKQIVKAEPSDREMLLKELEDFAFKGIPDVRGCRAQDAQILEEMSEKEHEEKMNQQREKQRELITQLKAQLEDLETYAYESGCAEELPTSKVIEKQGVLLNELRTKLDLDLENFDKLNTEQLKEMVDHAIGSIVNPVKVKEKLVEQLKTQVVDLERFIQFLQGESDNPGPYGEKKCTCPVHHKQQSETTLKALMKKALMVIQIYILSQLGCGTQEFKRNMLKKTPKGNHWGDLRAKLEVAITHTLERAQQQQQQHKQWQKDSFEDEDYSDEQTEQMSSPAVIHCVRKELTIAVRDLMQHGLVEANQKSDMVPTGCLSGRSSKVVHIKHAWDLLAKFYEMKHGREYNESPARRLSQSFHLDIVGGKPITLKQTLLGAIDTVLKSHSPYKCSKDSHFKAFICLALNERKLVTWLRLLARTQTLVDNYYYEWSYMARTGFEDALQSLEKLSAVDFSLPVDIAVRSFNNIQDAF